MSFTPEQKKALAAPLHPQHVAERAQAGRKLSYIEGWHAIAEANRIFGFDAWTRETLDVRMVAERERQVGQGQGWGVSYVARVRVVADGIVREGYGAGHGIDRDLGLAHESAIKEAETDAMKRALMTFGNPFGLALYDKTQANVGVEEPEASPEPQAEFTSGGRKRKPGPRLTDAGDANAICEVLIENALRQSDPDTLAAWWKKRATQIASLPDPQYDRFASTVEKHKADLVAQRVAS